jgi:tetratricopeptide (TPR) repeat protein
MVTQIHKAVRDFICLLCAFVAIPVFAAAQTPTFNRDIAPILFKNCVTCHHPGQNSPFSLQTYTAARPWAKAIRERVITRYMPPWKPEPGYGDRFQGARVLEQREIDMIERWVSGGAPEGNSADLPEAPQWTDDWRLGVPDVVIRMPNPYDLRADGPDVFRNFVLPIPISDVRYVQAIEFIAGSHAVHHANLRIDETRTSRERDAEDPLPGYDGLLAGSARFPEGYFLGWTPGQLPPLSPDLAWRLNPGSDMVVQLHLRPTGHVERIQVSIGLYFTPKPPRLTPTMLRLGKQYMDIPPGESAYVVTDSYVLPVDVDVHAVQPHAHYRARKVEGFATLPDGKMKGLIRISDWNFDWQDTFRYVTPFTLPKGTTLTMRYTYDNSAANPRNPQLPPQRVRWGQNSTDEMGDLWIQVVAHSDSDTDLLVREFRQKVFREDILGYESVLGVTPNDVSLHDDVALLYMAVGRMDDAISHFSESAQLAPNIAATHFNLGTAMTAAGRIDAAIAEYRKALQLKPDYALAHNNLGSVLLVRGNLEEADLHLRRAVEIDPAQADAHNNLAKVLMFEGHTNEAIQHLQRALEIKPQYPDAHYNLARASLAQGRSSEAAYQYRKALTLRPDWPAVLSEAAWLFATHPDARVRDPEQAISLAERAVANTNRRDPTSLDALAAAYAAGGSFDKATAAAQAARSLLLDRDPGAESQIRERMALYQKRQRFVDVQGAGPIHPRP